MDFAFSSDYHTHGFFHQALPWSRRNMGEPFPGWILLRDLLVSLRFFILERFQAPGNRRSCIHHHLFIGIPATLASSSTGIPEGFLSGENLVRSNFFLVRFSLLLHRWRYRVALDAMAKECKKKAVTLILCL